MLCCASIWSQFYCYDIPAAVHDHLASYSGVHASEFQWYFNALYSAYSLPNFVLPLAFGWFVDRSSGSRLVPTLAVLACCGQLLVVIGVVSHSPWTAIAGRAIFGVGCESMGVVQTAILTHVFSGREIAFALALNISCARLATMTNDLLSPIISSDLGTPAVFITGFALTIAGLICVVYLSRLLAQTDQVSPSSRSAVSMWVSTRQLGNTFWIVAIMCVSGYACILPFTSVFVAMKPAGVTQQAASHTVSVVFLICAFLTPVFGRAIDRFGRAAWISTTASLLLCATHAMYTSYDISVVIITLGIGYSAFVAAVWPLVPLTVHASHVGLAYGIVTSIQNLGLTVVPMLIASLRTAIGSYQPVRWMFFGFASVALLLSLWLARTLENNCADDDILLNDEERIKLPGPFKSYGIAAKALYSN